MYMDEWKEALRQEVREELEKKHFKDRSAKSAQMELFLGMPETGDEEADNDKQA